MVIPIKLIFMEKIKVNKKIKIQGWIRTRRSSKIGISFLNIYDGSCIHTIQVIAHSSIKNYSTDVLCLTAGCSISIIGILVLSKGKSQKYEIEAQSITVLGWVNNPKKYPISSKNHTTQYLREVSHLRARTNVIGSICRIRNTLSFELHNFFFKNEYYWIPTPIITSIDTEGSGAMFRVSTLDFKNIPKDVHKNVNFKEDFFGKESFLTVSGQLTLESYACAISKAYTFGPTFRAENSNTSRHLSEFWMVEVEQSFSNLNDIIKLSENIIKYIIKKVLENNADDIYFLEKFSKKNLFKKLTYCIENHFLQIDYIDAIEILKKSNQFKTDNICFGIDLSSLHEKYLVENHFNNPVIITNYPKLLKPFYMRINKDKKTVAAMDILFPEIGEIIGGSQREERIKILDQRINECGLNKKDYKWYRDLRYYGTVPHSGFGLGFERLMSYVTGMSNVKDLIPFPRTVKNSSF
ncbi:asparagine--tRNA ligase [Buchnera aphidicola]|uniref:Asparagine--tRNA ligase n=1 Tax=Buchnera aphidicola (Anoecia oenotherae) TaxID=1241833 RepID=A0A4D6Y4Q9_9GAMM|nr:asparagine--tRNA ligase [Buchnera aphidicola]QCI19405.1 asparagine--tRNA ligase [Buchnera aphidicola (Anoecia oenotherae)]